MDTKANLNNRKKINELAIQHNKLTTLVACLLNEVSFLKKELSEYKAPVNEQANSINNVNNPNSSKQLSNSRQQNHNRFGNINDLRAEDILKQLSINNISDN